MKEATAADWTDTAPTARPIYPTEEVPLQCLVLVNGSTVPQDPFFIRPLLSRSGDVADFSNTKEKNRVRQNEETKE